MINNDLDLPRWRGELAARGRTQIVDFLQPDAAQKLHDCLAHEVPFGLAERGVGDARVVGSAEQSAWGQTGYAARLAALAEQAREGYAFAYDSYMMIEAYANPGLPQLPLLRFVVEFLNSPEFIAFARELTGHPGLRRASAQATRYRPGHFLKRHNDAHSGEGRQFAYVINLTERWEADWGGQLQFLDAGGAIVESFLPRFNALSLFRVPAEHLVTLVAPWAAADRLAITGWFLT